MRIQCAGGEANERGEFAEVVVGVGHRSLLRGREGGGEAVKDVGGDVVGGRLVAVHAQHVKACVYQTLGRLVVEMNFSVAAVGSELEPVVRTTVCESLRDHVGVGFQDHGKVGPNGLALSCDTPCGCAVR